MKIHKITELIPEMSDDQYQELKNDIKKNGLKQPILLFENQIIDGRTRHRACTELGIQPKYTTWDGVGSLVDIIVSFNLKRRHLTQSQKAAVGVEVEAALAVEAKERQKRKPNSVVALMPQQNLETKARDKAAEQMGVAARYIQDAKAIKTKDPEAFKAIKDGTETIYEVKKKHKLAERTEAIKTSCVKTPTMPSGAFAIIYADPPWRYDFQPTENRAVENHYKTMELSDICAMNVPAAENSVLYLWATAPKLQQAFEVMEAWGFKYKTCAVWDKEKIGQGYWFRGQHELILVGTKGDFPAPSENVRVSSVIRSKRTEHSKKPTEVYELIEAAYPDLPKLELFARAKRKGWEVFGNEV